MQKGKSEDNVKGKYLFLEASSPAQDVTRNFFESKQLGEFPTEFRTEVTPFVNERVNQISNGPPAGPESSFHTRRRLVRIESTLTKEELDAKAASVIAAMRKARRGRASSEASSGDEEVQRVTGINKENPLWYTGPIETILPTSPTPRERLYQRFRDSLTNFELEDPDATTPKIYSFETWIPEHEHDTPKLDELIDRKSVFSLPEAPVAEGEVNPCLGNDTKVDHLHDLYCQHKQDSIGNNNVTSDSLSEGLNNLELVSPENENENNERIELKIQQSPLSKEGLHVVGGGDDYVPLFIENDCRSKTEQPTSDTSMDNLIKANIVDEARAPVELVQRQEDKESYPIFTSYVHPYDTDHQSIVSAQQLFEEIKPEEDDSEANTGRKQSLLNAVVFGKKDLTVSVIPQCMPQISEQVATGQQRRGKNGSTDDFLFFASPTNINSIFANTSGIDEMGSLLQEYGSESDDDYDSAIDIVSGIRSIVQSPACELVAGMRSITQSPSLNYEVDEPLYVCDQDSLAFVDTECISKLALLHTYSLSNQLGEPIIESTENQMLDDRPVFNIEVGCNSENSRETSQTELSQYSTCGDQEHLLLDQLWSEINENLHNESCPHDQSSTPQSTNCKEMDVELVNLGVTGENFQSFSAVSSYSWTFVGDIHFGKYEQCLYSQDEHDNRDAFNCDKLNSVHKSNTEEGTFEISQTDYSCTLSKATSGNSKSGVWSSVLSPICHPTPFYSTTLGMTFASCSVTETFPYSTLCVPSCFSPMKGMEETSHIWDVNVQKRYERYESPASAWDCCSSSVSNVDSYLWNICLDLPPHTNSNGIFIEGGLYGNSWDLSGAFQSLNQQPPLSFMKDSLHEAIFDSKDDIWSNFSKKPLYIRQRSTSADSMNMVDLIYGIKEPGMKTRSVEILPSENSAFSHTIPHRIHHLPHVHSEPNLSPRAHQSRFDSLRLVEIKHLYKADTSILRNLGLSSGSDTQASILYVYFLCKCHFIQ